MIAEGFFPTFIFAEDVKLDNQQLANDIVAWSKQDKGVKKTNKMLLYFFSVKKIWKKFL